MLAKIARTLTERTVNDARDGTIESTDAEVLATLVMIAKPEMAESDAIVHAGELISHFGSLQRVMVAEETSLLSATSPDVKDQIIAHSAMTKKVAKLELEERITIANYEDFDKYFKAAVGGGCNRVCSCYVSR